MSKPVQIAIVVICLGAAGFLLMNYISTPAADAEDGIPEIYHYICTEDGCGETFSWALGEDLDGREFSDECPKCGARAFPAAKCNECGHYQMVQGHGTFDDPCPECGAAMPPLGKH